MEHLRLAEGEYRFARIVWENEPLPSGKLVELSQKELPGRRSGGSRSLRPPGSRSGNG